MRNDPIPKKHLGQNFLRDQEAVFRIAEAAGLSWDSQVLEIGPGEGVLTKSLLEKSGKVLAIELDGGLSAVLSKRFGSKKNFQLETGDILRINLPNLIDREFGSDPYKVVANIPYYITSPIVRLLLETARRPEEMILMVQKEVAERIAALPGKMSLLAVSVQHYADPELLFPVSKESFFPIPEVDSAVIRIRLRKDAPTKDASRAFFRIAKAGFSAKRKTLLNNLSAGLQLDRLTIEKALADSGIGPGQRAQELSMDDWDRLAERFA